jgi:hypothetical protein
MICALALPMNGCVNNSAGIEYCQHARPIYWETRAELDATPDNIMRAVMLNNDTYKALCGKNATTDATQ